MENLIKINSRFGFGYRTKTGIKVRENSIVKVNSNESKKLNLTLNDVEENYEVFIKDSYGAVLYREYFHKSEISNDFDLKLLCEGTYYLEIANLSIINMIPFVVNSNSALISETVYFKFIKNTEFGTMSLKTA